MQTLIKQTLVGIGQIFLQQNGLSGLLIIIAMFFSHWTLGVACFLGALIGTLTAKTLHFPTERIMQGLYGFNASLAFMCVMFTFAIGNETHPLVWGLGVVSSVVATLIMHAFLERQWVAYTFPFVLSSWLFCWAVAQLGLFGLTQTTPPLADYTNTLTSLLFPFYGWAEVNFGASAVTGALLFLAIGISSPTAAMWGVAAAVLGTAFAQGLFDVEANLLANGIYAFSPILVACAFAGTALRDFVLVIIGTLLAVIIQSVFAKTGLATYTLGFIVASWLLLCVKTRLDRSRLNGSTFVKILNP